MSPINKMAGSRSWCGGFRDKSFAFQDWKYADKRHKWKEKVQKNAQFPFVDKRKLFALKLSFEEFNLVFYTADRSAWLVFNQPRQRGFWRHLRYIPYSMIKEECSFSKRNFWIYKGFMDVFYILTSAWKKNHKMCIWNWFFVMCSTDLTCVNTTI